MGGGFGGDEGELMNPIYDAALALTMVELKAANQPSTTLYLGSDLCCTDDLLESMGEREESDPLLVAEAVVRRITTARGTLLDDLDYGVDIADELSRATTRQDRASLEGRIRGELAKDDRIDELFVTLTDNTEIDRTFELSIFGTTAEGPFRLVMAIKAGALMVQEMTAG
jgi:hypothetical protein